MPSNRDLEINLRFSAETQQAKQQINELQRELNNLNTGFSKKTGTEQFSDQIVKAQQSVVKLKSVLNHSINEATGQIDLTKFNDSLNNAGLSLGDLKADLTSLGDEGTHAFLSLAKSIVSAQTPIEKTNNLLQKTWETLVRTAKWQGANAAVRAFGQAVSGAYQYAQDLDKSLNSIRIVTGESADKMAQFANQANKSAQALSTSTLAYSDAALIYYQQGKR